MKKTLPLFAELPWVLGLAAFWALFHYQILFLGHSFVLKDASLLFYPLWAWGARVFQQGIIPLWNPDAAFGTPYACDPESALWYPPLRFFFFALNPSDAFRFCLTVHHLFGMVGFYAYGRTRGWSPFGSLFGAFSFGFSIHAISAASCSPLVHVFSWIPWIFLFAERHLEGKSGAWFFFSVSLAFQMSAGYPILSYLTLLVLAIETLITAIQKKTNAGKRLAGLIAAVLPAIFFNSAWMLPFAEFKPLSNLEMRFNLRADLPIRALATWLNPFLLGHPLHSGQGFLIELSSFFVGLPTIGCFLWALFRRKIPLNGIFFLVLLVLMALGGWFGSFLRSWVPFYSLVVRSGYCVPLVVFAASRLGAQGFESVIGEGKTGFPWLVLALLIYGSALGFGVPADLGSFWVSLVFFVFAGLKISPPLRMTLLSASLFASIWPAAQGSQFTLPKDYLDEPSGFASRMSKPGRIYEPFTVEESSKFVWGRSFEDACEASKNAMFSNWPLTFGKEESFLYESYFVKSYFDWCFSSMRFSPVVSRKILDYLDVRYVLGRQKFQDFKDLTQKGDPFPLSENPLENAKWRSVTTGFPPSGWANDLERLGQKGMDLESACFVSRPGAVGSYTKRRVLEKNRTSNLVELEAKGKGRALLVSSETAYPGWIGESDGKKKALENVNYGFRGVVLEDGEEEVTLRYQPTTFRLGCFLMLLACGFWGALLFQFVRTMRHA